MERRRKDTPFLINRPLTNMYSRKLCKCALLTNNKSELCDQMQLFFDTVGNIDTYPNNGFESATLQTVHF